MASRPTTPLEITVNGKPVVLLSNHSFYLSLMFIAPEYREIAYITMDSGYVPCDVYELFNNGKPLPELPPTPKRSTRKEKE
ncbi:MAG: hypothetical protein B0D91_11140 [Oceanospirillales bacterium LUC14_002_19_P2]|nr:MAG: hypothetical protein B0D91_11140 [Oceanospirillales bacterium LUC14_002_19_P2]